MEATKAREYVDGITVVNKTAEHWQGIAYEAIEIAELELSEHVKELLKQAYKEGQDSVYGSIRYSPLGEYCEIEEHTSFEEWFLEYENVNKGKTK